MIKTTLDVPEPDCAINDKISEFAHSVTVKKDEIIQSFYEAYICSTHEGSMGNMCEVIRNVQLNQKECYEDGKISYKFWFSLKDDISNN